MTTTPDPNLTNALRMLTVSQETGGSVIIDKDMAGALLKSVKALATVAASTKQQEQDDTPRVIPQMDRSPRVKPAQ